MRPPSIESVGRPVRGLLVLALVAAFVAAFSCKKADEQVSEEKAPKEVVERKAIDPATVATVQGVVRFEGEVPEPREVVLRADPVCSDAHEGPVYFDTLLVKEGAVQNAFIWIKEGLEDYAYPKSAEEVVVDQVGCIYKPRVVGVQVGQPLVFVNSDATNHNIHTVPRKGPSLNFSMPKKGMRSVRKLRRSEVMLKTKCDVHPWMGAWIGVLRHSAFAVTGEDGRFEIKGVPPGDYTLSIWHEKLGTQSQKISLLASAQATVDFTLKFP